MVRALPMQTLGRRWVFRPAAERVPSWSLLARQKLNRSTTPSLQARTVGHPTTASSARSAARGSTLSSTRLALHAIRRQPAPRAWWRRAPGSSAGSPCADDDRGHGGPEQEHVDAAAHRGRGEGTRPRQPQRGLVPVRHEHHRAALAHAPVLRETGCLCYKTARMQDRKKPDSPGPIVIRKGQIGPPAEAKRRGPGVAGTVRAGRRSFPPRRAAGFAAAVAARRGGARHAAQPPAGARSAQAAGGSPRRWPAPRSACLAANGSASHAPPPPARPRPRRSRRPPRS